MATITRLDDIPAGYDLYEDGLVVDGFDVLITTHPLKYHHTVVFASDDESETYLVDLGFVSPKRSLQPPIEDVVARAVEAFRTRS